MDGGMAMKHCLTLNDENALTEGADLEVADKPLALHITDLTCGKANLESEICHLRFLAQQGGDRKAWP